jgi:hypothetical protein
MSDNTCHLKHNIGLIAAMIILALGLIFAGASIKDGLENFRSFDRTVMMKGLAEREVQADLAIWPMAYTETGNDLTLLQERMERHGAAITSFLKRHGLKDSEIELQQVNVQDLLAQSYRNNNATSSRYIITQSYLVRTNNVDAVDKAGKDIGSLIKQGIVFTSNTAPTYLFTKLNEIKPDMIAEATRNAREAAKEFAQNSDAAVGDIKYASQGVFQILPRDQTYVVSEQNQRVKKVRVVSTIRFYLED